MYLGDNGAAALGTHAYISEMADLAEDVFWRILYFESRPSGPKKN